MQGSWTYGVYVYGRNEKERIKKVCTGKVEKCWRLKQYRVVKIALLIGFNLCCLIPFFVIWFFWNISDRQTKISTSNVIFKKVSQIEFITGVVFKEADDPGYITSTESEDEEVIKAGRTKELLENTTDANLIVPSKQLPK